MEEVDDKNCIRAARRSWSCLRPTFPRLSSRPGQNGRACCHANSIPYVSGRERHGCQYIKGQASSIARLGEPRRCDRPFRTPAPLHPSRRQQYQLHSGTSKNIPNNEVKGKGWFVQDGRKLCSLSFLLALLASLRLSSSQDGSEPKGHTKHWLTLSKNCKRCTPDEPYKPFTLRLSQVPCRPRQSSSHQICDSQRCALLGRWVLCGHPRQAAHHTEKLATRARKIRGLPQIRDKCDKATLSSGCSTASNLSLTPSARAHRAPSVSCDHRAA